MLILDSWIDASTLGTPNTEQDILKRGFQLDANTTGIKFPVGELRMQTSGGEGTIMQINMLDYEG